MTTDGFEGFDDLDNDEGDNGGSQGDQGNKSFQALRKHARDLEKAQTAATKELEELRAYKAEVATREREAAVSKVFGEVGLDAKQAKLYQRLNADVTPDQVTKEAVAAFAAEYGLVTSEGEEVLAPEDGSEGMTPIVNSGGPIAKSKQLTPAEWLKIMKTDPVTARDLFNKKRVDMTEVDKLDPTYQAY